MRLINGIDLTIQLATCKASLVGESEWITGYKDGLTAAFDLLAHAPTIDAEPVKHGEWIKKYDYCDDEYWTCSACNEQFYFEFPPIKLELNYCPNCGAKMDGERKET